MYVANSSFVRFKVNFDIRCTGISCSTLNIFVGINEQRKVVLYNLEQGMRWALPELNGVVSVSPIHRDTGFVVGGQEVAQLVDIPRSLITQVLQGLKTSPDLKIGWLILCFRFSHLTSNSCYLRKSGFELMICFQPGTGTPRRDGGEFHDCNGDWYHLYNMEDSTSW